MVLKVGRDEQGAVAIIVALFSIVVMLLGALVVEVGSQRDTRTTAQSAADAAVLAAAAAIYATPAPANPENAAYQAATTYAQKNWATQRSADDTYWTGCGVDYALTKQAGENWIASAKTPCVAFLKDASGKIIKVQVVVPGEPTAQFFGAVQGNTRALAQAGIEQHITSIPVVFGGSRTCNNTVTWSGSNTTINGGVHSNNDIKGTGSVDVVNGLGTYVSNETGTTTWVPSANNPSPGVVEPYPVSFTAAQFAPGGTYANDPKYYNAGSAPINKTWLQINGHMNGLKVKPGIYYTTGDIDLSGNIGSDVGGNTFVTSTGTVTLNQNPLPLRPYIENLMIFTDYEGRNCSDDGVKMSPSGLDFEGIVYAPRSSIQFSPSSVVSFKGALLGAVVKISGSSIVLNKLDDVITGSPSIRLVR